MSRTRYMDLDDRTEDARHLMRERPREARDFMEKYELSWVYHENALEGMVLTHAELRQARKLAHPFDVFLEAHR